MDILFIAPAFQPYCAVAATRPAAFARYLLQQGHSVRVLAAHNTRYSPITEPGVPAELISYADMWHAQDYAAKFARPFRRKKSQTASTDESISPQHEQPRSMSPFKEALYDAFDYMFNYPDSYMGWIASAQKSGEELIEERWPDIIFSTAPPHSANVVAAHLVRQYDIPWVAEFRDLWMDHPYHVPGVIRRFFETRLERRSLKPSKALVAVSEDARSAMETRFEKPCTLSYNGYEPELFSQPSQQAKDGPLRIVYAGSFYVRTRTPEPLFAALKALNASPSDIQVECYTSTGGIVLSLAERYGVQDFVKVHAPIPHAQVLAIQRSADVLLLMRWNDPREDGVIPGKVFEYIGADRPILSIGSTRGEVPDLLSGREHTAFLSETSDICAQLETWLEARKAGTLPDVEWSKRSAFTRDKQFAKVEAVLANALG